jgi:hypothetical protein
VRADDRGVGSVELAQQRFARSGRRVGIRVRGKRPLWMADLEWAVDCIAEYDRAFGSG